MNLRYYTFAVVFLIGANALFAQIPTGYYTSAENFADDVLKTKISEIIDGHVEFPYTSSETDVWDILKETDRDPNNANNVILVYSGVSVDAEQEFNFGNGYIREHVWAKSRGEFGTEVGPGTDVHALRPLDLTTNISRNNRSFDNCTNCEIVTDRWGNDTGSKRDINEYSFEPRDDVKGDVARMIFYMAVRYEGTDGYVDLEPSNTVVPLGNNEPIHGKWSTLLQWHRDDPVSAWEENRNDIIYNSYQQNRNPFIDHPEIAEHLWGTKIGINWPETVLSNPGFNEMTIEIYPNPAEEVIFVKGLTGEIGVTFYDTLGRRMLTTTIDNSENSVDVSQLTGVYFMNITSDDKTLTKKIVIK